MIEQFDVSCPSCERGTVKFSLSDVASRRTVRCTRGCRVQLEDEGGGARKADRAIRDLDRALKRLNRRIG